ncbi:hypothetical protein CTAYLR_010699 [Chrysophaeum taylorii]|uniref:Uncharacterized protein n=1 Tax=Chrysophaeum taylorii TaxID=2483200 RepID=A0AAD7XF02_9STRA|nr:hypothetical protein CTAYLR_010699 [Chrysophaeum taylorii]
MKVALVQPGAPLEIVTNEFSKRKTETAVAFVRGERQFGSDAYGMLSRKPEVSYARVTSLLGRSLGHPSVRRLVSHSPGLGRRVRVNETRGALGFDEWTVEELVAMILSYAKEMTRAYGGNVVRDCVIAVPGSWTQAEREAALAAARLADLRVLSLVDDTTAAAVHFGLDRLFETKRRVMFYDVGSESARACVVEYSTYVERSVSLSSSSGGNNKTVGQLEVVGKGWSLEAGSFALDLALSEVLASRFEAQVGYGIRELARPMAKIRASARKTKEILSANTEYHVSIPSLHDDVDFSTTVTRATLEEAGASVFEALAIPVDMALSAAGLECDDVDAVELVGGGARVPKVQHTLRAYLASQRTKPPLELGVHLNGDEAVALGAAFHGANVSTSFRVRKVGLVDYAPYAVGVRVWGADGFSKRATLFKAGAKLNGKPKTIAFQHDFDVDCELAYDDPPPLDVPRSIARYNITGIATFKADLISKNNISARPKVQLSFSLDASGITTLTKAEVAAVDDSEDATPPDTTTTTPTAGAASSSNATTKKTTLKRTLRVAQTMAGDRAYEMLVADAVEATARLAAVSRAEEARVTRAERLNDLEATIYATRNALAERDADISTVSTQDQRDEIAKACRDAEDWLAYDSDHATIDDVDRKRIHLEDLWRAILVRYEESTKRPNAVDAAKKALALARANATIHWPKSKPWLPPDDLDDLKANIDKAQTWLDDMVKAQAAKLPHETPAFLAADIVPKLKPVATVAAKLELKPKPVPKPPSNATANLNATNTKSDNDDDDAATKQPLGEKTTSTPNNAANDEL